MRVYVETGDPRDLHLVEENARFMRHEQFANLVANIKRDGALTQIPFVWKNPSDGRRTVLSGNHRVQAAVEAGLQEITWLECDEELSAEKRLAIQLSHNAIVGEDDASVLARLYQQIDDLELKAYSGLDDRTLELLSDASVAGMKEPALQYQTLSLTFLPGDGDKVFEAFKEAKHLSKTATEAWVVRYEDHFRLLQAIEEASSSYDVLNMASALTYVLDVFEQHRDDLQEGYVGEGDAVKHKRPVPLATVLGTDYVGTEDAVAIRKALKKMKDRGELGERNGPEALAEWARLYLKK